MKSFLADQKPRRSDVFLIPALDLVPVAIAMPAPLRHKSNY